jgi:hypothetical protein
MVGSQIGSGEHGGDAGHPARRIDVKGADARMGMRRANDNAVKRVRRRQIGDVTPAPPHEARVFQTIDAAPQERLGHAGCMELGSCEGKCSHVQMVP